jgi:predicted RNA-binding Zn ribbon-like protein
MTPSRPPALFLAEARGLDFLNSLAIPIDVEVEWLSSGADLLAWLEAAGLLDQEALDEVRALAKPRELDAAAGQARALREWFRGFVERHRGQPLGHAAAAELEPLNRLLARDEAFSQIVVRPRADTHDGEAALALVARRRRSPDALLLPIAQAMAELVTTADFADVKKCEGPTCVLHFLDTTRGRRRRWCSMAVCGNRAKQAAHRDRVAGR